MQTTPVPIAHFAEEPAEIRNTGELAPFIGRFLEALREHFGEKSHADYMWHPIISVFVADMAQNRGFTFQWSIEPVEDFGNDMGE